MCTGHEKIVRLLIENGAAVNALNANGDSALISSIVGGNHWKVAIFL